MGNCIPPGLINPLTKTAVKSLYFGLYSGFDFFE